MTWDTDGDAVSVQTLLSVNMQINVQMAFSDWRCDRVCLLSFLPLFKE
jgi:hypothetical protein